MVPEMLVARAAAAVLPEVELMSSSLEGELQYSRGGLLVLRAAAGVLLVLLAVILGCSTCSRPASGSASATSPTAQSQAGGGRGGGQGAGAAAPPPLPPPALLLSAPSNLPLP